MVPVSFEYCEAGDASSVSIAGIWTDWEPTPMEKKDHEWVYVTQLEAGSTVSFKFVVDGEWKTCGKYGLSNDGHGAQNNSMYVMRPLPTTTITTSPSDGASVTSVDPTTATATATTANPTTIESKDDESNLVERFSDESIDAPNIYDEVAEQGNDENDDGNETTTNTAHFSGEVTDDYADSIDTDDLFDTNKGRSQSAKSGPPSSLGEELNEEAEGIGFETAVKGDKAGCVLF